MNIKRLNRVYMKVLKFLSGENFMEMWVFVFYNFSVCVYLDR